MNKNFLKKELNNSRKSGDKLRILALSAVIADIDTAELRQMTESTEESCFAAIKKALSQEEESYNMYLNNGRDELAEESRLRVGILQGYLPSQLSEEDSLVAVQEAIESVGAQSMKDMGKVVMALKGKFGAALDMRVVSKIVKQKLA